MSPMSAKPGSDSAAPCAVTATISPTIQRAVSRSWIVTSTKNPPAPARNAGSGGVMSRSEVRNR